MVWLQSLMKHYNIDAGSTGSLLNMLRACMKHFLAEIDEETELSILAKRAKLPHSRDDDLDWGEEQIIEVIEAGDLQEVQQRHGKECEVRAPAKQKPWCRISFDSKTRCTVTWRPRDRKLRQPSELG